MRGTGIFTTRRRRRISIGLCGLLAALLLAFLLRLCFPERARAVQCFLFGEEASYEDVFFVWETER